MSAGVSSFRYASHEMYAPLLYFLVVSCRTADLFTTTAGEFYLDEMTNDWSVLTVIGLFFIMNVVLMNLLIAIMSNTCKESCHVPPLLSIIHRARYSHF